MGGLYRALGQYYDLIYSFKDYRKEAARLSRLIVERHPGHPKTLLDVACGTGQHLRYLSKRFNCQGVDIEQRMLQLARKWVPGVTFTRGDMAAFSLGKQFDVVTCLFSSIGYVKTEARLKKTLLNFSRHVKSGGLVIIEPWIPKSAFRVGEPGLTVYDGQDVKIARMNSSKVRGNISVLDFHYVIAERNGRVRYVAGDRHELGMFEISRMLSLMARAGFRARFLRHGLMTKRGLLVGVKR